MSPLLLQGVSCSHGCDLEVRLVDEEDCIHQRLVRCSSYMREAIKGTSQINSSTHSLIIVVVHSHRLILLLVFLVVLLVLLLRMINISRVCWRHQRAVGR